MTKPIYAAALALIAFAVPAQAQDAARPAKAKKVFDPNKRICKPVAAAGSRLGESVCHTRAEWDAIDEADHNGAVDLMGKLPAGH